MPSLTGIASPNLDMLSDPFPATIDYHDNVAGMTLVEGRTVPTRVFLYALDPTSNFRTPLRILPPGGTPQLVSAAFDRAALNLQFSAPSAVHYGVAL